MAFEQESALLWLPGTFALEVALWEADTRLGLGISDPVWGEFGAQIGIERITWGLGGGVVVLFALFMLISRERSSLQLSLIQLLGIGAMACYWLGAWVVSSGAVVLVATLAAWILSSRRAPQA